MKVLNIVVFGIGDYYGQFKYMIEKDTIIAFLDNDETKQGIFFDEKAVVIPPSEVYKYDYDRIYLASVHRNEMFNQLIDEGVPANKIFDIRDSLDLSYEVELYKDSEKSKLHYYVVCPLAVTGGPEALHQLSDSIYRNVSNDVFMVYVGNESDKTKVISTYGHYQNGGYVAFESIPDDKNTVIVMPEIDISIIECYEKATLCMWWLSVDNFFHHISRHMKDCADLLKRINMHLCQSKYAKLFLDACGIPKYKIFEVGDYTVIGAKHGGTQPKRDDVVLYNPAKGYFFTRGLIQLFDDSDIEFHAIENYTHDQVIELMQRSKVYIDMGQHPGKDRMPREAALNGCCVITGKRGAANNKYDIPIPAKYKFDQYSIGYSELIKMIKCCIHEYDEKVRDFQKYVDVIKKEKQRFDKQVINTFG